MSVRHTASEEDECDVSSLASCIIPFKHIYTVTQLLAQQHSDIVLPYIVSLNNIFSMMFAASTGLLSSALSCGYPVDSMSSNFYNQK